MTGLLERLWKRGEPTSPIHRKLVEEALHQELGPVIKEAGFDLFKGNTAWRHSSERIDVVTIEFFTRRKLEDWGATPYSFALGAGSFFPFIPVWTGGNIPRHKSGQLLPHNYDCHVRKTPSKTLPQRECAIPNIWYIDPKGKYLAPAISDATAVLRRALLPWFDTFSQPSELLRVLLEKEEDMTGGTWGFGRKGSPIRLLCIGFTALKLEKWELARDSLKQLIERYGESTFLKPLGAQIHEAIAKAQAALDP